jgi:hypothetical protein
MEKETTNKPRPNLETAVRVLEEAGFRVFDITHRPDDARYRKGRRRRYFIGNNAGRELGAGLSGYARFGIVDDSFSP